MLKFIQNKMDEWLTKLDKALIKGVLRKFGINLMTCQCDCRFCHPCGETA